MRHFFDLKSRHLLTLSLLALVSACGGGGGSGSAPTPPGQNDGTAPPPNTHGGNSKGGKGKGRGKGGKGNKTSDGCPICFNLSKGFPCKYKYNSIEYNTIYGQALSVLVFFMLWAVVQILFSRGYLARQVED